MSQDEFFFGDVWKSGDPGAECGRRFLEFVQRESREARKNESGDDGDGRKPIVIACNSLGVIMKSQSQFVGISEQ